MEYCFGLHEIMVEIGSFLVVLLTDLVSFGLDFCFMLASSTSWGGDLTYLSVVSFKTFAAT